MGHKKLVSFELKIIFSLVVFVRLISGKIIYLLFEQYCFISNVILDFKKMNKKQLETFKILGYNKRGKSRGAYLFQSRISFFSEMRSDFFFLTPSL